jgi:hypothetical protein
VHIVKLMNIKARICFYIAFALAIIAAPGCSDSAENLVIDAMPVCRDGEVWLQMTIKNTSSSSIVVENGVLPWDYDPVGTSFGVESLGKQLARNSAVPVIGRAGPIDFAPGQQRSGEAPLAFMFPEISKIVGRQPVTVRWLYWTRPQPDTSQTMSGVVEISRDPCANAG